MPPLERASPAAEGMGDPSRQPGDEDAGPPPSSPSWGSRPPSRGPLRLSQDLDRANQRLTHLARVAASTVPPCAERSGPTTWSAGPVRGWTASELLRTADAALDEAKRTGRDRLVAVGTGDPEPQPSMV